MSKQRWSRLALGLIALGMLPVGLQATFAPRAFFDDFPLGRHWISHTGDPFNEHLVRDVGGLFLAMIVVTAITLWRRHASEPIAIAWLIEGVLHLIFHLGHLHGFDSVDQVGIVASVGAVPVLAAVAWSAGRRAPSD